VQSAQTVATLPFDKYDPAAGEAMTIHSYLANDHRRLEDALSRATAHGGAIEPQAFVEFRAGLLRHIAIEEKILLPAAQAARGGQALPLAAKLRLDHGALAALLVLKPTSSIVAAMQSILAAHNPLEEGPNGVYDQCEQLAGSEADEILGRLQNAPEVKMAAYVDSPIAINSARQALRRAGYDPSF
jgi:hemerythrin HHE cation binding domain-containing protein